MHTERTYVRFLRYAVQAGFVVVTLFIGYRFYQFVQHFEVPGRPFVQRPAAVDAFLPIGGFMGFKDFFFSGLVEPGPPSGFFLFFAIVGGSLVMKKGFFGRVFSIGTLSQYARLAGGKGLGQNFKT